VIEKVDSKKFAYIPSLTPLAVDDGDGEVLQLQLDNLSSVPEEEDGDRALQTELCKDVEFEDGLPDLQLSEEETQDALQEVMDAHVDPEEATVSNLNRLRPTILAIVEFNGH
jgi:hypothetical protein